MCSFSPFQKEGKKIMQMSAEYLVCHNCFISSIILLVNEVGYNHSQVNVDWGLIILINQRSMSIV